MNDNEFYKQIDLLFESYLSAKKDGLLIRVKDISQNKILENMNYSKVFFDSDLNIYKIDNSGKLIKVEDTNFEAVVVKKQ